MLLDDVFIFRMLLLSQLTCSQCDKPRTRVLFDPLDVRCDEHGAAGQDLVVSPAIREAQRRVAEHDAKLAKRGDYTVARALLDAAMKCERCQSDPATRGGYGEAGDARLVCDVCHVIGAHDLHDADGIRHARRVVAEHDLDRLRSDVGAAAIALVETKAKRHAGPAEAIEAEDVARDAMLRANAAYARAIRVLRRNEREEDAA